MGWASAGEIFNPVAQSLIDCGADEQTKRKVLGPLIGKLQDGDWDTEDESLERFGDDLVIRALFYGHGVGNSMYGGGVEGVIGWDAGAREWVLRCMGRSGCGQVGRRPFTAQGHDQLVHLWVTHDADLHDGDREVPDWMLIEQGPQS